MTDDVTKPASLSFSYDFSPNETALIAHFFRDHEESVPAGLEKFAHAVEKAVYDSISIGDAERFYS